MAGKDGQDPCIQKISSAIRVIPDFPKPGIMFQDITTLLLDTRASRDTIDLFVERYKDKDITVVAGIEARGFIFGPPIALAIGAKLVPMRKPNKLPERVGVHVVECACVIELPELKAASDCLYISPRGIRDLLLYTKTKYHNPVIYIMENGVDEFNNATLPLEEALLDNHKIDYHCHHLWYLHRAVKDDLNVKGYFAWTLLDDFEWIFGYTLRFGINYVDFKDGLKRYPKFSAHWFKNFLKKY